MALPDLLKISLEFSPKLGVRELPQLSSRRESNVRGLYVVGDLADAPIIKIALKQGYDLGIELAEELSASPRAADDFDVVIAGAGPAGIGAALALDERGCRYILLERERPFETIQNFPKGKLIFSEPRAVENPANLWFEDSAKEDLVARWEEALNERKLVIRQPEAVLNIERDGDGFVITTRVGESGIMDGCPSAPPPGADTPGASNRYRARRVILATGRRGSVRRLGIPGERLDKVDFRLRDPADYHGKRLLVVGGGDSAVEAATSCADAGAEVTVSYRSDVFSRAKPKNRERIEQYIADGRIRAELRSSPTEILEHEVLLSRGDEEIQVPNDRVLVLIGTLLPRAFLEKLGIRMAGEMDRIRAVWITAFALFTYCFYVLKQKQNFFPFGEGHPLAAVPSWLEADLVFRTVDASFWGTCVYATLVVFFGLRAYRKYPSPTQKRRYISLITFQCVFLFGIPELLAPLLIDRPWKIYAATVPWPLSIWSLVDSPAWAGGDTVSAVLWLLVGATTTFVLIPLYVRRNGERFCSYLCGCGGLAETLGDQWRHLAPRGLTSYRAEWLGRIILFMAVPVTALILSDAWGLLTSRALLDSKEFAQHWYGLMVDFWLASVVGVALYPYLGNRIWCRFVCPLRAYMEILSRWFSRIAIQANEKCIGCGECTRYCQMGIDVQRFAQRQETFDNTNSACIQCGICIEVCPMSVLELTQDHSPGDRGGAGRVCPAVGS